MPDFVDFHHANAALSLLRLDTVLTVYPDVEGFTPVSPAAQYVRVYTTIERPSDANGNALSGQSQQWITRWYCHCVGENEYAALAVAMRVRNALLDVRPIIAGRNCGFIREDQALPPIKDDTTGGTVLDAVCVYRLTTT